MRNTEFIKKPLCFNTVQYILLIQQVTELLIYTIYNSLVCCVVIIKYYPFIASKKDKAYKI